MSTTEDVLKDVAAERERQDQMWGEQNKRRSDWLSILGEEYGESCEANNDGLVTQYRKELIQAAAVAVAAVESLDRGNVL